VKTEQLTVLLSPFYIVIHFLRILTELLLQAWTINIPLMKLFYLVINSPGDFKSPGEFMFFLSLKYNIIIDSKIISLEEFENSPTGNHPLYLDALNQGIYA